VVAQGQAKANDALSRSITPILVKYKGIEKWNGILPQFSGGGAVPFVDLSKMSGGSGGMEGSKK
jgi:prohibitin 1